MNIHEYLQKQLNSTDKVFDVDFRVKIINKVEADLALFHLSFGKNHHKCFDCRVVAAGEAFILGAP